MSINLHEFDLANIRPNSTILIIGGKGVGKSTLVHKLLKTLNTPKTTIISPTEKYTNFYGSRCPKVTIYDEYTPELIEQIIITQHLEIKKIRSTQKSNYSKSIEPQQTLVLEDYVVEPKYLLSDRALQGIYFNRKFLKVSVINIMTSAYLPPYLRAQVDYIFIFKNSESRRLWEAFGGMVPNIIWFGQILSVVAKNYGCLVIDNQSHSHRLEDQVFWYKVNLNNEDSDIDEPDSSDNAPDSSDNAPDSSDNAHDSSDNAPDSSDDEEQIYLKYIFDISPNLRQQIDWVEVIREPVVTRKRKRKLSIGEAP